MVSSGLGIFFEVSFMADLAGGVKRIYQPSYQALLQRLLQTLQATQCNHALREMLRVAAL
jgi:hypothetical protein